MSATAIGRLKAMVLSLDVGAARQEIEAMLASGGDQASLREPLRGAGRAPRRAAVAGATRLRRRPALPLFRSNRPNDRQRQSRSDPAPPRGIGRAPQRGRRRRRIRQALARTRRTRADRRRHQDLARQGAGARRTRRHARRSRRSTPEMREMAEAELADADARSRGDGAGDPHFAAAQGRRRRRQRHSRGSRGDRRRRGRAVRGRPVPHVSEICGERRAGRSRCSPRARARPAATRKSSPKSSGAALSRG